MTLIYRAAEKNGLATLSMFMYSFFVVVFLALVDMLAFFPLLFGMQVQVV